MSRFWPQGKWPQLSSFKDLWDLDFSSGKKSTWCIALFSAFEAECDLQELLRTGDRLNVEAAAWIPDSAGKGRWNAMSFRPTWSIASFRPVRNYTVSPVFSVGWFVCFILSTSCTHKTLVLIPSCLNSVGGHLWQTHPPKEAQGLSWQRNLSRRFQLLSISF